MTPAPIAYHRRGAVVIRGDGPELLVFSGSDDSPLWKQFCQGVLVAVGACDQSAVAVDSDGAIGWYRLMDGAPQEAAECADSLRAAAIDPASARVCAVGTDQVHLVAPGGAPTAVPVPGACAAAYGQGGRSIGVGTESGTFYALDPASGGAWGSCSVGAPVAGVAWCGLGYWVVSTGTRLVSVAADGSAVLQELPLAMDPAPLGSVACSEDGVACAVKWGEHRVALIELQNKSVLGSLELAVPVGDVAFGPAYNVAAGAADEPEYVRGDLNTGHLIRNKPHTGRGHRNWKVTPQIDSGRLRAAAVASRVGGQAIATRQIFGGGDDEKKGGCLRTVLIVLGVIVVCSGLLTCAGFLWWWF
jgi:hypothetical protein